MVKLFSKPAEPNGDQVAAARAARDQAEEVAKRVAEQAAAAEQQARRLHVRLGEVALTSVETGDPSLYETAEREFKSAQAEANRLRDASKTATARADKARMAEARVANADQISRIAKRLKTRYSTAVELEGTLGELVKIWRRLCQQSEDLITSFPGGQVPTNALINPNGDLLHALEREIYRQSARPNPQTNVAPPGRDLLPGGAARDYRKLGLPHELQSLPDAVKEANNLLLDVLSGKRDWRSGAPITHPDHAKDNPSTDDQPEAVA